MKAFNPLLPHFYRYGLQLCRPLFWLYSLMLMVGGMPAHLKERWARKMPPRPKGSLLWFHGASYGEVMAIMPIVRQLHEQNPDHTILITSSSKNTASTLRRTLPPYVIHQVLPFDLSDCVNRFLTHWRPTHMFWSEADFWPTILLETHKRGIPGILLNGRFSEKSFTRWRGAPPLIRDVMQTFQKIYPQTPADFDRFTSFGTPQATLCGNLKFFIDPPKLDEAALNSLNAQIKSRPLFLAASTHPGEEEIILKTHKALRKDFPTLLTILVPRHPKRAEAILALCKQQSLTVAQRSQQQKITASTAVYLADTLGELGLFYALAPFAFVGGSLVPIGGHTPVEATLGNCALISGPHVFNNTGIFEAYDNANALLWCTDAGSLTTAAHALLSNAPQRETLQKNANALLKTQQHYKETLLQALQKSIEAAAKEVPQAAQKGTPS